MADAPALRFNRAGRCGVIGWFQAVVLGVVQGLTEFVPVSSSAHLRVVSAVSGWPDPGAAFTAVSQLGTETAVLLYFRSDIAGIIRAWTVSLYTPEWRKDPQARLGWYVIAGTVPIGLLGLTLQDTIETAFRDLRLIGTTLVVFGMVLAVADRLAPNVRPITELSLAHAVGFGVAQALALMPGVSRSGGTITAGLVLGYRREAAARYSFLLAVPAVWASGLLELTKIGDGGAAAAWGPTMLATVIAFVVGYAVIAWFLRYVCAHSFLPFVVYRVAVGLLVIGLVTAGVLAPDSGAIG